MPFKFFDKEKREEKKRREELVRRNPQLMAGQDMYTFRRSRTLTGTTSSKVKGASEATSQLKSPRLKAHELHHHRRRVLLALFATLFMAAGTYWLLWQYTAQVKTINYRPALVQKDTSSKAYLETVRDYLNSHPLERFRFALNLQSLQEALQKKHPEIELVSSIEGGGLGEAILHLSLREPVVGWKVGSSQYYVDGSGVSFRNNYFRPPGVTVRDLSGVSPSNGGAIASNRFLSFLGRVVSLTSELAVGKVTTVTIPAGLRTRTVEISLKDRQYPIRMHIDRDPAAQVEDVKRAMRYLATKGVTPKYVDVRIAGKAFFR